MTEKYLPLQVALARSTLLRMIENEDSEGAEQADNVTWALLDAYYADKISSGKLDLDQVESFLHDIDCMREIARAEVQDEHRTNQSDKGNR